MSVPVCAHVCVCVCHVRECVSERGSTVAVIEDQLDQFLCHLWSGVIHGTN